MHLPRMHEALGSPPSTEMKQNTKPYSRIVAVTSRNAATEAVLFSDTSAELSQVTDLEQEPGGARACLAFRLGSCARCQG